jgi:hypothetical protein
MNRGRRPIQGNLSSYPNWHEGSQKKACGLNGSPLPAPLWVIEISYPHRSAGIELGPDLRCARTSFTNVLPNVYCYRLDERARNQANFLSHTFSWGVSVTVPSTSLDEHRDLYNSPDRYRAQLPLMFPIAPLSRNQEILLAGICRNRGYAA